MAGILLRLTLNCIIILGIIAMPALSISVSFSSAKGGVSLSFSERFDLDLSTLLQEDITQNSGQISLSRQAEGTGKNSLTQSISGDGYALNNDIESLGSFSVSTSAAALPQEASLSQDIAGVGSMSLTLCGTQGSREAGADASVDYGALSSGQCLSVGQGVFASQSTDMAGLEGFVGTGAVSEEMALQAAGSFQGQGTLRAALTSSSQGDVDLDGQILTDGILWLKKEDLQQAAMQSGMVTMQGIRVTSDGLGSFETQVASFDAGSLAKARPDQVTALALGGSSSSYVKKNWRWNSRDPRIQLYLKDDQNLKNEGLTSAQAQAAITNAANSWDDVVAQNLFADGTTVIIDANKNTDNPYDGFNVHAWKSLFDAPGAIAYSRTRTNAPTLDGYLTVYESDVSYNSDVGWSTMGTEGSLYYAGSPIDLHTVAMHELGHTLGLGDLYNLPDASPAKSDLNQVMNRYNDVQRMLGNGDRAGVQALYALPGEGPFYGMSAPYTKA
jgi:hypothetical protein